VSVYDLLALVGPCPETVGRNELNGELLYLCRGLQDW
jgi:hypothetical protein